MTDRYSKIDFGSGTDTPTGDTVYQGFTKTNDFMDGVENDLDLIDSQLIDLNTTSNTHTSLIDDLGADLAVLDGKVDALNTSVNDDIGLIESKIDTIENDLNNFNSNFDNYYTKTDTYSKNEVDNLITNVEVDLTDYYNKTEIDTKLDEIESGDVDLTNYYNKTEVDGLIQNVEVDLTGYATTDYVDSAISNIDFPETDLTNYYTKSETYNKTEVDDLIQNSGGGGGSDLSNYYTKTEVDNKTVFGQNAVANGTGSVAIGIYSKGNGTGSVAIGRSASTIGNYSIGFGYNTHGNANNSVAIGFGANANANNSVAIGYIATGDAFGSVAIGEYSTNNAFGGIAIGRFNDPILTEPQSEFNEEHPLFLIGNGTGFSNRKNAFVMLQNGKSEFTNIASYKEDYSVNFTDNSLVNKKYVDDLVASSGGGGEIDLSNYYTKTEVDTELSSYAHAQITYVDNQLILKADKLTTYTKVEVDGLIDNIDVDLTGYATTDYVDSSISNIDFPTTDLSNYYTKTEIYNKTEVDDLIAGGGGGEVDFSNYYTKSEVDKKTVFGTNASGTGVSSVAIGYNASGTGAHSVTMGTNARTNGSSSVSIGPSASAVGKESVAVGNQAKANAINSVAIGYYSSNYSFGGISLGRYNDPILTSVQSSFNAEHPLFIIGNGTSGATRSNAFVMLQNGKSEFTNIANYKEDYSEFYTDNSLVNKKFVEDLVASSTGGETVGELVTLNNSTTIDITWNNDIVICDSSTNIEILVPSGLGNLSFVVRNIGEGNVTLTTDGTSYLHPTSSGQVIETGQITSVIINDNLIISTGTL